MNPITNKTVAKTITTSLEREQGEIQKTEPSKFDKVRADQLQKTSAAVPCDVPPAVTEVPGAQKQALLAQLTQRVDNSSTRPGSVLKVDMQNTKTNLDKLGKRVAELPKGQAYDPIRNRLASIEKQFENSAHVLTNIGKSTNPKDYIQLQMQMYLMTENIQLVSKVVDQVTSGVKTILQTQI